MKHKCELCKKEIKTTFLEKLDGTILRINSKKYYVCSTCQKEHKEKLKEKLS